jgi:peptide/nickel transport system permease protein
VRLRRALRAPLGLLGAALVGAFCLLAAAAPLVAPYPPLEMHMGDRFQAPSAAYLFGTDEFGRDILSRVVHGARISIGVGLLTAALAALVGVPGGLAAGYQGGMTDTVIMRLCDCIFAFPAILLGLAIVAILGPGPFAVTLAVTCINVPIFARIARASMLAERGKTYVEAAQSLGSRPVRIMFHAILPNCAPPILVQATVSAGYAILLEAALSFLGLGSQPPEPSWGTMLNFGRTYLNRAPWYGIFPGLAISLLVLGLHFFADALRDAWDPTRPDVGRAA